MIRVLHALNELHPSGAERMLASAAPYWSAVGVESVILGAGERHPFAEDLRKMGCRVELIPTTRSVRGLGAFRATVRALRPHVVHLHAESMFAPMAVAARSSLVSCAVLRTVHSVVGMDDRSVGVRTRRRRLAIARLAGMGVFACSNEVAAHESTTYGPVVGVIENWVDTSTFGAPFAEHGRTQIRASLGIDRDEIMLTLVGNCSENKNHELVFDAIKGARSRLRVVHVGQPDRMSDREREIATPLMHDGRVTMLGRRNDVAQVMSASDVVAVPSKSEGFSVVAAEALCSGVPVLASRSPGLLWLGEFRTPRLLTADVAVWTRAFDEVAHGRSGSAADLAFDRESALARFSPDRGVAEWAAVYRTLIGNLERPSEPSMNMRLAADSADVRGIVATREVHQRE